MKKLRITIENKTYDVTVEDLTDAHPYHQASQASAPEPASAAVTQSVASAARPEPKLPVDSGAVTSPMAGSIKSVLVKPGESVKKGQPLVILEAMKMENQITAPVAGSVKSVDVAVGESVQEGHVLVVLE